MDYLSEKNMGSVRFPILGIISSILTKYFLFIFNLLRSYLSQDNFTSYLDSGCAGS